MEGPRGYLLKDLVTEKETENCYDHFSAFWLRSSVFSLKSARKRHVKERTYKG